MVQDDPDRKVYPLIFNETAGSKDGSRIANLPCIDFLEAPGFGSFELF